MIAIDFDIKHTVTRNGISVELDTLSYIKHLRRIEKKTDPIAVVSYHSFEQLLEYPGSNILGSIGHYYCAKEGFDLVTFKNDNPDIKHLNPIQLKDVIYNYCRNKSFISAGFHDFKGRLNNIYGNHSITEIDKKKQFESLIYSFKEEIKKESIAYPGISEKVDEVLNQYDENDISTITKITSYQEGVFSGLIPADEDKIVDDATSYSWKVLILDDEPNGLNALTKALEIRKIAFSIVTTVQDAKKEIEADIDNDYTVVVADYRLYTDEKLPNGKEKMQVEQGYDFLIWLAEQNRYNSMIALSGLSNSFLMDSFRQYNIDVKVYSKNTLNIEGAGFIVDDIIYLGHRMYETTISIPTSKEWDNQLKPYYHWLKTECTNKTAFEDIVRIEAEKIIHEIDGQIHLFKAVKTAVEKYRYFILSDCKKRASEKLPNKFDSDKLDLFQLKLIYRRVIIYYCITDTISINLVCKLLNLGSVSAIVYDNRGNESNDQNYMGMKKQVLSNSALSVSDIPFNILIEEKNWLYAKMGIEITKAQVKINPLQELITFTISALAQKHSFLKATSDSILNAFASGKSVDAVSKDLDKFLQNIKSNETTRADYSAFIKQLSIAIQEIKIHIGRLTDFDEIENVITKHQNNG